MRWVGVTDASVNRVLGNAPGTRYLPLTGGTLTGQLSINGSGSTYGLKVGADQTNPITMFYQGSNIAGLLGGTTTTQLFVFSEKNGTNNRRLNLTCSASLASIISDWDSGAIPFGFGAGSAHWQVSTSGHLVAQGGYSVTTGAPSGGTAAAWKFGAAASVSPTSPNRTIELDVGGTIYYLHAKTTND